MGFETRRLLLLGSLWLAAGAVFASASSARAWVGATLLLMFGLLVARPLATVPSLPAPQPEPPRPRDALRLVVLQAQFEYLPVAAWVQVNDQTPQPLSSRARKLCAPGRVRDQETLNLLLRNSSRSGAVMLETERGSERWLLQRQALALEGQSQTLLVLVPLEQELETESLRAWQELTQVLTHEIMNSLTPIKSLSQAAVNLLKEPGGAADLATALETISRRADSLARFVGTYRQVSRWPPPTLAPVELRRLFDGLEQAVRPAWTMRGGEARFELASPSLRLQADEGQLEQALLALFDNAEQATRDLSTPHLWVQARQARGGRFQITVRDNGPGVPRGLERQIFLPFFSAREGGQGVGLTVVRQLVHGMGGRVRHVRPLEGGATFVLSF